MTVSVTTISFNLETNEYELDVKQVDGQLSPEPKTPSAQESDEESV